MLRPAHQPPSLRAPSLGRRPGLLLLSCLVAMPLLGQYPGRIDKNKDKPAPPLRSTAVLEWTGEAGKPSASRIVPIAIFDGDTYQPGGLYLAQPAPLAVEAGTEYVLQEAGTPKGLFDINSAQNVQGAWFGYGVWKPWNAPPPPRLKRSQTPPVVVRDNGSSSDDNSGRPTLKKKSDTPDTQKPAESTSDPDKPALHRRPQAKDDDSAGTDTPNGPGKTSDKSSDKTSGKSSDKSADKPAETDDKSSDSPPQETTTDPDRPTLHRRSDTTSANTGGTAPADPDRPKMHKAPATVPDSAQGGEPGAPVSASDTTDPDRPHLQRGRPTNLGPEVEPTRLTGQSATFQQMVAVSDDLSHEPHSFRYQWADSADAAKMQAALEEIARKALSPASSADSTSPARGPARRTAAHRKAGAPPVVLSDEHFAAFELAYSGGATLVFSARLGGDAATPANAASPASEKMPAAAPSASSAPARYITLIAQPDFYGVPQILLQSVTGDDRLDETPRMRLVDAVDTNADNRAELIFELRSRVDRQFAIYQVVHGRAEQVFATGVIP